MKTSLTSHHFISDIPVSTGRYDDYISYIIHLAANNISSYVCLMNVHMLVEAHFNNSFKAVIDNATIVAPDGKPLTWALRLLQGVTQSRVPGIELVTSLLNEAARTPVSVFFYGGTTQMLDMAKKHLAKNYGLVNVAGYISPPFRPLSKSEEDNYVDMINSSSANIVFVVLGCPKQEVWMASMKGRINAVMIGIGGALPMMVGMQKRAPYWMQEIGMEWLYRLSLEPRRLFGRYALTNSVFIFLFLKQLLKNYVFAPVSATTTTNSV